MISAELKEILNNYLRLSEGLVYVDYTNDIDSYYSLINSYKDNDRISITKFQIYQDNQLTWTLILVQDAQPKVGYASLYPVIIDDFREEERIYIHRLTCKSVYFIGAVNLTRLKVTYSFFHKSGREMMTRTISQDLQAILDYESYIKQAEDVSIIESIIDKIKRTALIVAL